MISTDHEVRRSVGGPVFTQLDDELLGLDTGLGLAYGLNDSAARVWELIEEWTAVADICGTLELMYVIDHSSCYEQVVELLTVLERAGLVELREGGLGDS